MAALRRAGVTLAARGDNVRDPFNPLGRGDPLETAALLVAAGHVDPAVALDAVTGAARTALGRAATSSATVADGDVGDVMALPTGTVAEAVAAAPADRLTFRAGQLVARRTSHEPATANSVPRWWVRPRRAERADPALGARRPGGPTRWSTAAACGRRGFWRGC